MSAVPADVSRLLQAWGKGDVRAAEDLMPIVYRELRKRAAAQLRGERQNHTLQPTALVHEAYVRLAGQDPIAWQNRAHFFAVSAQMMRRVLVDHARHHRALKRPGNKLRVTLDDHLGAAPPLDYDVLLLDSALSELSQFDARQASIVELRFFGGLSEEEIASLLSLSRRTVTREWQTARAWLYRRMTKTVPDTRV
jgi:RNA polymerase sigma factor (TIGR02999 family)